MLGLWLVSTMPKTHIGDGGVHDDSDGHVLHFIQTIFCYLSILMYLRVKDKTHQFGPFG